MKKNRYSINTAIPILIALFCCLLSCASEEKANDGDEKGQTGFHDFYVKIQEAVLEYHIQSGDWEDDFGDAAYYGLAFYVNAGESYDRDDYREIARQAKERNIKVIRDAKNNFVYFIEQLEEVLMAELGLIEYVSVTGDTSFMSDIDDLLDLTNETVDGLGPYLEIEGLGSYALETYGPTSITGVVALVNLRYAELLDSVRKQERLDYAESVIGVIDEKAFNGNYYKFNTKTDDLYLYPNLMMILSNAVAFKLTGDDDYKRRCIKIHESIQPLKDAEKKCYHSPYSAVYMGAQTEDYSTLSSQNYAIMSLAMLYEITENESYKNEINDIISFIRDYLYDPETGKILHHWMDGRLAVETDPEYFCSGCNLQFLYSLWYVEAYLYGGH